MLTRRLGLEIVLVIVVSAAVLAPGIQSYTLVDPWETHYGEVARRMRQDHDFVHTEWSQDEGFRSKPVLTFWLMAAGMGALGVAADGGYSGELVHDARTQVAIRLPIICCAIAGLVLMWWMLARLISRRAAWLGLLVVGSCPFFCLIARQGIPDMPCTACLMGALAMFVMAVEDGERPVAKIWRSIDARHLLALVAGGFVVAQAIYYAVYFFQSPILATRAPLFPGIWLPGSMLAMVALAFDSRPWALLRKVLVPVLRAIVFALVPLAAALAGYLVLAYGVIFPPLTSLLGAVAIGCAVGGAWAWLGRRVGPRWPLPAWQASRPIAERLLAVSPIATMRQVYLLWCYALLGVSVLAKGPPALAVAGLVGVLHIVLLGRWRALYDGAFELKRGVVLLVVTFLPWHIAMFLKDGIKFIDEYLFTHILNRAAVGVDNSPGTFEYYSSQLGHGMWLWAALVPAALLAALLRTRLDTRRDRVRFLIALWAIAGTGFFCVVQTKFHHYILPVVPALGILVALYLDDILAGRDRLHPLLAAVGIGLALLVCRDLVHEPKRWIEMFVFRYDRPWPSTEPWTIDPGDGFLALGIAAAVAIGLVATRLARAGVICVCAVGLAICVFALQAYMPVAGRHWGMGDAVRTYYRLRTIYGVEHVYFGAGQAADALRDATDTWRFESYVPDALQLGQPMTVKIRIDKAADERVTEAEVTLLGTATAIGDHDVTITLAGGERDKLAPIVAECDRKIAAYPTALADYNARLASYNQRKDANPKLKEEAPKPPDPLRGRRPVKIVDADRLVAWQLYWRGENFWSGDEIWGWLPETKTAFVKTDNVEWTKYINDRTRAPLGRRYFIITEASKITSLKGGLPTPRARESYEVLDTTSNKFQLAAFWL
jgi:4-amino-4-deoxy-L-arabinose transferase-like glycosyltransferase